MIDVKKNFSNRYENLNCELCNDDEEDSQKHLLKCKTLLAMCSKETLPNDIKYEDIFSSPEKQLKVTRYVQHILKIREKLQNEMLEK